MGMEADDRPLYVIREWAKHFEKSDVKKVMRASWVAMPNKHDGKGYRRLARHPRAVELFCAWCLIVQVASKCNPRGVLGDTDGPLTAEDLSDATGFPAEIFTLAFNVLCSKQIGWICDDRTANRPDVSGHVPGPSGHVLLQTDRQDREDKTDRTDNSLASARGASHQAVVEHFFACFERRYGGKPTFRGARDGKHVKWVLEKCSGDETKAKAIVGAYLEDDDRFLIGERHNLGQLVSKFDRYRVPLPSGGNGMDGPTEFTPELRELVFREGGDE